MRGGAVEYSLIGDYVQSWSDASFEVDNLDEVTVSIRENTIDPIAGPYRIQKSLFGNASGSSDVVLSYFDDGIIKVDTAGYGFPYQGVQLGVCDEPALFKISVDSNGVVTLTAIGSIYGDDGANYITGYKLIKIV